MNGKVSLGLLFCGLAFAASPSQPFAAPWDDVVEWKIDTRVNCRDPTGSPTTLPPLPATPAESASGAEKELYRELVDPIHDEWEYLTDIAHEAWREGHSGKAACVLNTLQYWADADAFRCDDLAYQINEEGDDPSTNKYWRSRFTSGVATSYLKVRSAFDDPLDETISQWFWTLGDCSKNFTYSPLLLWDGDANNENVTQPQNMVWPSIQGVLAAAIAVDDLTLYEFAIDTYLEASALATEDGVMASEMARENAALFYHTTGILNFQVPFTVLARNADPLFRPTNGTRSVVARVLQGVEDPSWFADETGFTQDDVPCYARQSFFLWYDTWGPVPGVDDGDRYLAVANTEGLFPSCFPETSKELMTGGVTCDWMPELDRTYANPCDTVSLVSLVIGGSILGFLSMTAVCWFCCCRAKDPK